MPPAMPQEIEVWYLLPALRKEIARVIVKEKGLTQKKAAEILGITEPAVSQYLKAKRGSEFKFSEDEQKKIQEVAQLMLDKPEIASKLLYEICVAFRGSQTMCELHKKHDATLPKKCEICMGDTEPI